MIQIANIPTAQVTSTAYTVPDWVQGKQLADSPQQHLPEPAVVIGATAPPHSHHPNMSTADWDLLLDAVLLRLENCARDTNVETLELLLYDRHSSMTVVVCQCIDAIRQLQVVMASQRQIFKPF